MPVYEYLCTQCKRKFRKLVGMTAQTSALECPRCRSAEVQRLLSRFARVRSEDDTLDDLAEEMEAMGDTDDPAAIRRLVREMGKEMGEDLEADFDEMMEEEASGAMESEQGGESDAE